MPQHDALKLTQSCWRHLNSRPGGHFRHPASVRSDFTRVTNHEAEKFTAYLRLSS